MINQSTLLSKLRNVSVGYLHETSRVSTMRLVKDIYNNREIRDINKLIRDTDDIIRKTRQAKLDRRALTEGIQSNRKYDDNELKELSYDFQSVQEKHLVKKFPEGHFLRNVNSQSFTGPSGRIQNDRNRFGIIHRDGIKKRFTMGYGIDAPQVQYLNKQKIRKLNSISSQPKSFQLKQQKKRLSTRDAKQLKQQRQEKQEKQDKVKLKQQQVSKALNHLISLINTKQSKQYYIPREQIFKLLELKYFPKGPKQICEDPNLGLLHKVLEKLEQCYYRIDLPYCQFNNLQDSRKSLNNILNMPLKMAQKIAFKIYDRNCNGVIDQNDIIQLFLIAEDIPAMQNDIQIIVKNYKVSGKSVGSSNTNQSEAVIDSTEDAQNTDAAKNAQISFQSSRFRKSNYFTFKLTKDQFFKRAKNHGALIELTWEDFQLSFQNKRPQIFYDLLNFLFGLNSEQLFYSKSNQFRNLSLSEMNHTNGKSQCESMIFIDVPQIGNKIRRAKATNFSSGLESLIKKSFIGKQVQSLITRASAVEHLETMRYC